MMFNVNYIITFELLFFSKHMENVHSNTEIHCHCTYYIEYTN